jgi:hypothetical protein
MQAVTRVLTIEDPATVAVAVHPARAALLAVMRRPTTAAAAARATNQSRQNAAYHVRELVKAGLLRHAGSRQNGNFQEQLYVAAAPTILISPRSTWGDGGARHQAAADQLSLGTLVSHGEQLQRDAAALLDRAAFDGEEIPSASVGMELRFSSERDREAFLRDYLEEVRALAARHGASQGVAYRVLFAAYPDPEES